MSTLAIKGRIADLTKKKEQLAVEILALVHAVSDQCDLALTVKPEDIRADSISSLAGNLAEQRREYREVLDMIRELEREV